MWRRLALAGFALWTVFYALHAGAGLIALVRHGTAQAEMALVNGPLLAVIVVLGVIGRRRMWGAIGAAMWLVGPALVDAVVWTPLVEWMLGG